MVVQDVMLYADLPSSIDWHNQDTVAVGKTAQVVSFILLILSINHSLLQIAQASARSKPQSKLALPHIIWFNLPKTQNSTWWAAVVYKSLELAHSLHMGTTNIIKKI